MKGFKKDGKFRPTGNRKKSALDRSHVLPKKQYGNNNTFDEIAINKARQEFLESKTNYEGKPRNKKTVEGIKEQERYLYQELTAVQNDVFFKIGYLRNANWDSPSLKAEIDQLLDQGETIYSELDKFEELHGTDEERKGEIETSMNKKTLDKDKRNKMSLNEKRYQEALDEQMGNGILLNYSSVREFKKDDPIAYEIGLDEFQ